MFSECQGTQIRILPPSEQIPNVSRKRSANEQAEESPMGLQFQDPGMVSQKEAASGQRHCLPS